MAKDKSRLYIPALGGLYASLDGKMEPFLRIMFGLVLIPHGAQKLFGWFGGGGLEGTAGFLEKVGYAPGMLWAVLIGALEFFGGIGLVLGLLTRPIALATLIFMIVAFTFHFPNGYFWIKSGGGYEYPVVLAVLALFFFIRGAPTHSVDASMGKEF